MNRLDETIILDTKRKDTKIKTIWASAWNLQQCVMCDQQRLRPACVYAQSDQSISSSLEYSISVKLLTEHLLESKLKICCTCSFESTLVKMLHCWKSHVTAHFRLIKLVYLDPLYFYACIGLCCQHKRFSLTDNLINSVIVKWNKN